MASWDFNSWDFKKSFTYRTSQKAKRIIDETINTDKKKTKSFFEEAFTNHPVNGEQQNMNSNQRTPPGTNNTAYRQNNGENDNSSGYDYTYNYGYRYTPPEKVVTPPPGSSGGNKEEKSKTVSASEKVEKIKKQNEGMLIIRKKSCVPFYAVAVFWIICACFASLYTLKDIAIALGISVVIFALFSVMFKGKKIFVEKEIEIQETGDEKVDKTIQAGKAFAKKMHQASIDIENKKISEQIKRLEEICIKITEFISKHPQKASSVKRFMNYYVPTTLKLLESYDTLEEQEVDGENIKSTMTSIENAVKTIVKAFEKQLDSLFEDEAMDISTDISVLEGILHQEGLLDEDDK